MRIFADCEMYADVRNAKGSNPGSALKASAITPQTAHALPNQIINVKLSDDERCLAKKHNEFSNKHILR